ncbi:hypothetical protein [Streptomyces sp. NPDC051214]|uniref:hypothetical protein n=1 Tax=Streptomyces sp. NPDC051214 TaxID=3155282 RepID=UPI0034296985
MSASPSPLPVLPDERLAAGAAWLATWHAGRFAVETVQVLIADSYRRLAATARVRTHLVAGRTARRRAAGSPRTRRGSPGQRAAAGAVRVQPQRRTLTDGRRHARPPCGRPRGGVLGGHPARR